MADLYIGGKPYSEIDNLLGGLSLGGDITIRGGGSIVSTSAGNITIDPNSTGQTIISSYTTVNNSATPTFHLDLFAGADTLAGLRIHDRDTDGSNTVAELSANVSTGQIKIGSARVNYFPVFFSNNAEAARIDTVGNMGIGTISPTARLSVDGVVNSISGGVSSNWVTNSLSIGHDSTGHASWIQSASTVGTALILNAAGGAVIIGGGTDYKSSEHNGTDFKETISVGSLVCEHSAPAELADDGSFDLPTASAGFGTFLVGDAEEFARIAWDSSGAVDLLEYSGNVVSTDTDTKFCIFDNGTAVRVRNRLGAAKKVVFKYNYTTP